jgi:alpha-methylacyl-CoA racemase
MSDQQIREFLPPSGPLVGLRVVEFASIGPGPHCAMLLADLGADVLRIDRAGGNGWPNPVVDRGRAPLELDIRTDDGRSESLKAADHADVVIEGFRPGVMERLGLGPDVLLTRNPRLVYGRMTGWGQHGPLSHAAGHDINYIALSGALAAIGRPGEPAVPPLNLVGDFGAGSMFLAFGIMAALWERERSGKGQVIDAAIVDGVGSLMSMFAGLFPSGRISVDRQRSLLGGAAPFYRCYQCADGKEISIGPLEPQFFAELLEKIGAPAEWMSSQNDASNWLQRSAALSEIFKSRSAADWCRLLEGTDVCFAPVLPLEEVPAHAHIKARQAYIESNGLLQSAPAPRFSRTPGSIRPAGRGADMLVSWSAKTRS